MADFDSSSRQPLTTNVMAEIQILLDGYRQREKRVSHWVQKDGIQNCWDARIDPKNKKKEWKCVIELHEGQINLVTITDTGTWGLTGRRLDKKDLLGDQPVEERWCRFENYAFRNDKAKDKHLLGSRGRGKFVFSGASKTMTTLYDTLLKDKSYRLGRRVVEKLDAPTWYSTDNNSKDILRDQTKGMLKPLTKVGARIIIMEPIQELVDDIKDGTMAGFISYTWWEIIEKHGAQIIVRDGV